MKDRETVNGYLLPVTSFLGIQKTRYRLQVTGEANTGAGYRLPGTCFRGVQFNEEITGHMAVSDNSMIKTVTNLAIKALATSNR